MGSTWLEDSSNFSKCGFRVENVLHNVLSYQKVKCRVWKRQMFKVFATGMSSAIDFAKGGIREIVGQGIMSTLSRQAGTYSSADR